MNKKNGVENWDWEKNDKEYYEKFLNLPEAQNKKYYEQMKEHRYRYGKTNQRIDMRPKVFFKTMKIELILLIFGVSFAISNLFK
jgi:hypothetical protein